MTAPTVSTDFVQSMFDLRERQMTEMQVWLDKYGADPTNAQAQKALLDLRDKYFAARSTLLEKYGVTLGAGHGMSPGYGRGMMGCGGGLGTAGV